MQLSLERHYDSDEHYDEDPLFILNHFYIPCLSKSTDYRRLAGFFSSSTFELISDGLMHFVLNGGHAKLITSPHISEEDCEAVLSGEKTEPEVINESLVRELFVDGGALDEHSELLGWLVANNRLEIRLAVMYNYTGRLLNYEEVDSSAIFHHKLGIFQDDCGNTITFNGSINETAGAWSRNGESFDVFCSWKAGQNDYIEDHIKKFEKDWSLGKHSHFKVVSLPDAVKEQWIKYIPKSIEDLTAYRHFKKVNDSKPSDGVIKARDYQLNAVNNWVTNGYRGLFDMATGTGKTKTALFALKKIVEDLDNRLMTIIVCPYLHLTQMWEEEVTAFGFNNYVVGHSQSPDWKRMFERKLRLFNRNNSNSFILITTINTFCSDYLNEWIGNIKGESLIIVDEVHRMGSKNYSSYLNPIFKYRLGLSATIDRFRDPEGTRLLFDYFGEKCISYSLSDALYEDRLVPYKYHPVVCYFNDEEYERIININTEIENLSMFDSIENSRKIQQLRINGSRLIAKMDDKILKLVETMKPFQNSYHMLIYCGATSVVSLDSEIDKETGNSEESERLISYISRLLYEKYGINLRTFTCADNMSDRKIIIDDFKNNRIQSILAIRCLDEGVDIPDIRYAFILSSSDDPKEYIQRRGRVLRKGSNKPYAEIFDFLAFPRTFETNTYSVFNKKIELGLILKELKRVNEFSRLSLNPEDSNLIIDRVAAIYDVDNIRVILNDD